MYSTLNLIKNIYSDGFVLNNGPTPAQFLLSDGTSTILNDSEYIISNTPPFNTISDITKSKGDVYYVPSTSSIYGFQPPFYDEPMERSLPAATYTNANVGTEAEFVSALNTEIPPQTTANNTNRRCNIFKF